MYKLLIETWTRVSLLGQSTRHQVDPTAGLKGDASAFRTSFVILAVLGGLAAAPGAADAANFWDKFTKDAEKLLDKVDDVVSGGENEAGGSPGSNESAPSQPAQQGANTPRFDRPWVKEIQSHLTELGYDPGPADGVYGAGTQKAARKFQQNTGQAATGLPTPSLMSSLRAARQNLQTAQPQTVAHPASTGPAPLSGQESQFDLTYETQRRLNQLGYDAGVVDGLYGGKTKRAIRAFQQAHGLPVDGQVTPQLVTSLRQAQGATSLAGLPPTGGVTAGGFAGGLTSEGAAPPPAFRPIGPMGPDVVAVKPAKLHGKLVTGFPLSHGIFSKEDVQVGYRTLQKHSYELARYMDLAVIKAFPDVLQDPNDARRYALRFLTSSAQGRYLSDCRGSCQHSANSPYLGWVGDNEFERENSWRAFVDRFGPQLAQSGPVTPLPILNVTEVEFDPYDKENSELPFRLRRGSVHLFSGNSRPAHGRFRFENEYEPPKSVPASSGKARSILESVEKRRAYLALHLSLVDPVIDEMKYVNGRFLTAKLTLNKAALYADPDLTEPLHEFGIHELGGVNVAAGTLGTNAPAGSRIVKGPGGEELLEFKMPPGLRPVRMASMNGTPVLGYPVQSGKFSPNVWQQRYGRAPEFETGLGGRLVDVLHVGANPKLLHTLSFAERFAQAHLTEDAKKEFLPCGGYGLFSECQGHNGFGANEFQRQPKHEAFTKRYLNSLPQTAPRLPFEYLHVFRIRLGEYDPAKNGFPVITQSGRKGSVYLQTSKGNANLQVPELLPIPAPQAETLILGLDQRNAYLAVRVAITGFKMAGYQEQIELEPQGTAIYSDEALTQLIHKYPRKERKEAEVAKVSLAPFWSHYGALFVLRDIDGLLTETSLIEMTKRQIEVEQNSWNQIGNANANANKPTTTFEWQSYLNTKPEIARGDLLRVFTDPHASWEFLDRETRYGLTPSHQVHVFMFNRNKVAGKRSEFAARDLAPVFRTHLKQAISDLPTSLYVTAPLPSPEYDFDTQELVFQPRSSDQSSHILKQAQYVEYLAPGETHKGSGYNTVRLNAGDPILSFYRFNFDQRQVLGSPPSRPSNLAQSGGYGPLQSWRSTLAHGNQNWSVPIVNAIGFDRVLTLPRLAMTRDEAERVLTNISSFDYRNKPYRAVVEFEAQRATAVPDGKYATLIAKLKRVLVLDSAGKQIANLSPDSFPGATESKQAAEIAKAQKQKQKQNQTQQAALAQEESKRKREAEFARCDAVTSAEQRVTCFATLCDSLATSGDVAASTGQQQCQNRLQRAKSAAASERRQIEAQARARENNCRSFVKSNWGVSEGMPLYDEAFQACLTQQARTPYGPDIVGIQLGMDRSSADALVLRRMDGQANATLREAHPFDQGLLRWTTDASRGIAIFTVRTQGKELVAGISRRLFFEDKRPRPAQIAAGLRKKYGSETWSDDQSTLVWTFPGELGDPSGSACHELVDFVAPRDGWTRPWAPVLSASEQQKKRQQQAEAMRAQSNAHMRCVMEASANVQPSGEDHDNGYDSEYMNRLNEEMALCNEKYGAGGMSSAQSTPDEEPKVPFMTRPEGDPGTYGRYAACGPVVVSHMNLGPGGTVRDASFVLFDPSWLATLPTIAFKAGPGVAADTGGADIDF